MAHIDDIWFHSNSWKECVMDVQVALRPSGSVRLKVAIPEKFRDAILRMAQTAADQNEAQMQAEILGERHDAA